MLFEAVSDVEGRKHEATRGGMGFMRMDAIANVAGGLRQTGTMQLNHPRKLWASALARALPGGLPQSVNLLRNDKQDVSLAGAQHAGSTFVWTASAPDER